MPVAHTPWPRNYGFSELFSESSGRLHMVSVHFAKQLCHAAPPDTAAGSYLKDLLRIEPSLVQDRISVPAAVRAQAQPETLTESSVRGGRAAATGGNRSERTAASSSPPPAAP